MFWNTLQKQCFPATYAGIYRRRMPIAIIPSKELFEWQSNEQSFLMFLVCFSAPKLPVPNQRKKHVAIYQSAKQLGI